jgi:hypothetical protein
MLLGVPAFLWAERDDFDPSPGINGLDTAEHLTWLRTNHGLIGFVLGPNRTATPVRMPVAGAMQRLVAVSGINGTIHVAWFGPAQGSADPDEDGTVWYAERHNDRWTTPRILFSADRLDWTGEKASMMIRNTSDVHLVVPYYRGKTAGIAYIRRVDGRWTTTETALRGLPSQTTAQFIGADSLAVAFAGIGAPGIRVPNGQHVYLIRAALSDTIWPGAKLVHWSGLAGVRWLKLYTVPLPHRTSHALALVWNRLPRDSQSSADTVYAMLSEDAGVSWHSPQMLPLPFKLTTLTQSRDKKGDVHIVVTSSDLSGAKNAQLYHAALRKGRWTDVDSVPAGRLASVPTLSSIGPDAMLLAWGIARSANRGLPGPIAPVSEYVTLGRTCSSPNRP